MTDRSIAPSPILFPWTLFLTGSSVGVLSSALLQPFDVLKTTMIKPNRPSNSMIGTAKFIISEGGVSSLWRGLSSAISRIAIGSGVYFTTQTALLSYRSSINNNNNNNNNNSSSHPLQSLISGHSGHLFIGALSRATAVTICCPISVVKTRMESQTPRPYRGLIDGLYTIGKKEGLSGLYLGLLPSIAKDAPYAGVYLMFYSIFKQSLAERLSSFNSNRKEKEKEKVGNNNDIDYWLRHPLVQALSAGGAASLGTTLFQPLEVIKTRLQLEKATVDYNSINNNNRKGTLSTARLIVDQDGALGLFRGLLPRLLRRSLANAISWMLFEQVSQILKNTTHL